MSVHGVQMDSPRENHCPMLKIVFQMTLKGFASVHLQLEYY
jgi:hypothetical protein